MGKKKSRKTKIILGFWDRMELYGTSNTVPDAGFEPATFGLQNRCSTN